MNSCSSVPWYHSGVGETCHRWGKQQEAQRQCDHISVNNPVWMRECVFIRVGVCGAWVSSFVVFVPSESLSLSLFYFFLLAGSKRGEVVAVLVLSPEAQPLLVGLLILVFGPVALPRTAYSKTDRKSKLIFETVRLGWLVAENKQETL